MSIYLIIKSPAAVDRSDTTVLSFEITPTSSNGHVLMTGAGLREALFARSAAAAATKGDQMKHRYEENVGPRPPLRRKMSFMSQGFAKGIFSRQLPTTNVFGIMYLEELPSLQDLKRDLCTRILTDFPRFRSILTVSPVNPQAAIWTELDLAHIDLDRLFIFGQIKTADDVCRHVETHMNRFWETDLPVWRCHVLRSLDRDACPSAVVLECNHAIGDGLSLVRVALSAITDKEGAPFPPIEYVKKHPVLPKGFVPLARWAVDLTVRFVVALWAIILNALWIADTETAVKSPHLNHDWVSDRRMVKLPVLSLDTIKALKNAYHATVNDVIMAALAGAYRRYLAEVEGDKRFTKQEDIEGMIMRAVCPFSFPRQMNGPGDLHNRFAMVTCPVPSYLSGPPSRRVAAVHGAMETLKTMPERPVAQVILQRLVNALFGTDTVGRVAVSFASRHTVGVTNVPGPQTSAYLSGRRVVAVDPVVTSTNAQWAIFSYDGGVNINFNMDERR
ncbi:hypothetical protein HDU67_001240, partial [Dinochytrium kinnereticum]